MLKNAVILTQLANNNQNYFLLISNWAEDGGSDFSAHPGISRPSGVVVILKDGPSISLNIHQVILEVTAASAFTGLGQKSCLSLLPVLCVHTSIFSPHPLDTCMNEEIDK